MDIEKLIEREAPKHEDSPHDHAYANALRRWYVLWRYLAEDELKHLRLKSKLLYKTEGATHNNVARLMISHELLREKRETHGVK